MKNSNLLQEIRESEGLATANSLAGLMRRWLECQDAQDVSRALARALSAQAHGDPLWPGPGIWLLRRFLANNGQALIAEYFELSLMLGESIIDSAYGEAEHCFLIPKRLFTMSQRIEIP